eukprot:4031616-Alexandrium_andersonii.AAC.1
MRLWSRQMRLNRVGYRPPGAPRLAPPARAASLGRATTPPDPAVDTRWGRSRRRRCLLYTSDAAADM